MVERTRAAGAAERDVAELNRRSWHRACESTTEAHCTPPDTSAVATEDAMRNDARPIGEDAHDKSPIDEADPKAPAREPPIVNRTATDEISERDEDLEADQDRRTYGK